MLYSLVRSLSKIAYSVKMRNATGHFRRDKALFFMYHGITDAPSGSGLKNYYGYNITKEKFREQAEFLARNCNVIKASDAVSGRNLSVKKKNVVITFDDGYRNNYLSAYPLLMEHGLPALYSLSTDFVSGRKALWNDLIEYAVINTKKNSFKISHAGKIIDFSLASEDERLKLYDWLIARCVSIRQEERDGFISEILNALEVKRDNEKLFEDPDYSPLTQEDIKTMALSGTAEFASHSAHHYNLTKTDESTLLNETSESKKKIEELSGMPCRYFCIPGGHHDKSVDDAIFKAGYEKIFTSEFSEMSLKEMPDVIGRYCITDSVKIAEFADIVEGPFHRLYYSLR
ncbi:MAG: polysaccharide deacetylase family protein [Nitrospirae bacterium]|nr:polysaccharide deacetylase family protein [Nitrospirota bacterium]